MVGRLPGLGRVVALAIIAQELPLPLVFLAVLAFQLQPFELEEALLGSLPPGSPWPG